MDLCCVINEEKPREKRKNTITARFLGGASRAASEWSGGNHSKTKKRETCMSPGKSCDLSAKEPL